ncbi:type II toxin-antitoxin system death-on-curing family toxin [Companilactobacillus mishanensis]|uniref:Type II toxin-antitoxin system death-on-curing family toxin n=1 Tax=Companilactobacillus mishanensis TaxID=2486008 RepID=A0A5P0ZIR5_9LACO|nr:type II toxin-antitoxin system death-on-curing family toxin [Companilactobacillus mishanensis]MQS52980.1 type II toxin-antitoxin system death-on-curing family toxin [Companilactobacillus mishanensis]
MTKNIKYLSAKEIAIINLGIVGDRHRIKFPNKLEIVETIPKSDFFGKEMYDTIAKKAGILFIKLINLHCFDDGNKRTALISLDMFLDRNGFIINLSESELAEFAIRIAKTDERNLSYDEIYRYIEKNIIYKTFS